jgi:hypothetical protein
MLRQDCGPSERRAADILRYYLKVYRNIQLPVTQAEVDLPGIILEEDPSLHPQAFEICNIRENLVIRGGKEKGIVYGVWYFLRTYAGIEMIAPGVVVANPEITDVALPQSLAVKEIPSFATRTVYSLEGYDADYCEANMLQIPFEGHRSFAHTFESVLLPSAKYFNQHPEYYALIEGKRNHVQPCLTNETVASIAVNNLRQQIKGDAQQFKSYSVSLEDNPAVCRCATCDKASKMNQGNYMGVLLPFVNRIATQFPSYHFTTLAYESTKAPPTKERPASNVQIILTNADNNKWVPVVKDGFDIVQKLDMRKILPRWLELDKSLILWEYTTNYTLPFIYWPFVESLPVNLRYWDSMGVRHLFLQDAGLFKSGFSELKSLLYARLMWDNNLNIDSIALSFCQKYYGKEGSGVFGIFKEMNDEASKVDKPCYTFSHPEEFASSVFKFEKVEKWKNKMNNLAGSSAEPMYADRIEKEWLWLELLQLYLLRRSRDWDMNLNRSEFDKRVAQFIVRCDKLGIKRLTAEGLEPSQIGETMLK